MHQYSLEGYSTINTISNSTPRYITHAQYLPLSTRSNISSQYTIRKKVNPYGYNFQTQNKSHSQRWKGDSSVIDNEVELMKIRLNCELLNHKISKLNSIILPKDHQMTNRSLYNLKYTKFSLEDTYRSTAQKQTQHQTIDNSRNNDEDNSDSCNLSDIANDIIDLMDTENRKEQDDENEGGAVDIRFGESADGVGDSMGEYINDSNRKDYCKDGKYSNVNSQIQCIKSQSMTKGRVLKDQLISENRENSLDKQINSCIRNIDIYEEDKDYESKTVLKNKSGKKFVREGEENVTDANEEEDDENTYREGNTNKQKEDANNAKTVNDIINNNSCNNDKISIENKEGNTIELNENKNEESVNDLNVIQKEECDNDNKNEYELKIEKPKRNSNDYNGKGFKDLRKRFDLNDDEDDVENEEDNEREEADEDINNEEEENEQEEGENEQEEGENEDDNNEEVEQEENEDNNEQEENEDNNNEEVEQEEINDEADEDNNNDSQNNEVPENIPQNIIQSSNSEREAANSLNINKNNPAIVYPNITSEDEEEMILSTIISNAKAQEETERITTLEQIISQGTSNPQSLQNSNQQSQLNSNHQSHHNSNQPSQQFVQKQLDQTPVIKTSPAKPKKTVQFSERELVTINYNEKEKITQLTLFDADGENIKFKPRNLERYLTLLSSAQPKSIILTSSNSNKAIALETLNNLLNEEKEDNTQKTIPLSNSKKDIIYGNNEITQRNILKCQEIQNKIQGGAKTFWKIKERHKVKKVKKHNCKKFEKDPQRFFTENLCLTVLKSYDIKTMPNRNQSCSPSKVKVFTTREDKNIVPFTTKSNIQKNKEENNKPKSYIKNLKEMVENVRIEIINEERDDNDYSKDDEESNQRKMSF